eukprot:TRINITY_DN236_c0_g7_i1.p1 TRINITY_DN236_c0_g7~~TRINITY_DN236_c0_g7_i1.p1  ORF type:complete len:218 (+),score=63.55 TRINITY_DN236_c0_g7_i1:25-654(+)
MNQLTSSLGIMWDDLDASGAGVFEDYRLDAPVPGVPFSQAPAAAAPTRPTPPAFDAPSFTSTSTPSNPAPPSSLPTVSPEDTLEALLPKSTKTNTTHIAARAPRVKREPVADKPTRSRNAAQQFRIRQKEKVVHLEDRMLALEKEQQVLHEQTVTLRQENETLLQKRDFLRSFLQQALNPATPASAGADGKLQSVSSSPTGDHRAQHAY